MMKTLLLCIATTLFLAGSANAGVHTDDLAKCLLSKTTKADEMILIKSVYTSMSFHPDVASMSNITLADSKISAKQVAEMFNDLLLRRCRKQTELALKHERREALKHCFRLLGRIAMRGLMTHPNVRRYNAETSKYLNKKELDKLLINK